MNIVNMQKVLDYIKAHPDEFDMKTWGTRIGNTCKSPACIGGTASFLYCLDEEITLDSWGTNSLVSFQGRKFLELTKHEAEALFYVTNSIWEKYKDELGLGRARLLGRYQEYCPSLASITQQHAITMLENLISGKWDFSGIESLEV